MTEDDTRAGQSVGRETLKDVQALQMAVALLQAQAERIEASLTEFVRKVEFYIVRNLVFGLVIIVLSAVFGAVVSGVLHR